MKMARLLFNSCNDLLDTGGSEGWAAFALGGSMQIQILHALLAEKQGGPLSKHTLVLIMGGTAREIVDAAGGDRAAQLFLRGTFNGFDIPEVVKAIGGLGKAPPGKWFQAFNSTTIDGVHWLLVALGFVPAGLEVLADRPAELPDEYVARLAAALAHWSAPAAHE